MNGSWIKIVLFVLAAVMLAGVAQVLLDPGLGKPDEDRRVKHPRGFSVVPPNGWGATVFYTDGKSVPDYLRVSPERVTGRQPSIGVSRFASPPKVIGTPQPYTFQNQPATLTTVMSRNSWLWQLNFERDGVPYNVYLSAPQKIDVEKSPLWPFIESFRIEPILDLTPATLPASLPATTPTAQAAER